MLAQLGMNRSARTRNLGNMKESSRHLPADRPAARVAAANAELNVVQAAA
jgi:hypothetical protein